MKIDFFVVAAARSGTTALYVWLKDHPQVCLSAKKEFDPFDANGNLMAGALAEQFSNCKNPSALRGVMPVMYNARAGSSALVKKHFPKAKIIMCLRNPIERAYSQYKHNVARGVIEGLTFGEAIKSNAVHLEYGMYADAVERYRRDFGKESVRIFLFDETINNGANVLTEVQKFLGIEQIPSDNTNYFFSVSREGRKAYHSLALLRLHQFLIKLSAGTKKVFEPWVGTLARSFGLHYILTGIAHLNHNARVDMGAEQTMEEIQPISSQDRTTLRAYYAADISRLSNLLEKDIAWS